MRVLLVTDWNRGQGGAEAVMAALRDGLRGAGDEVGLLTSSAGTAGDGTADYVAFGTEHRAAQTFLQIANPFAVACVRRALAELRPDVALVNMFAHHLSPAILGTLADAVPTVMLVSDYKCICPLGSKLLPDGSLCGVRMGRVCRTNGCLSALHWLRDQPRYALLRAGVRRMSRVVACSQWVREELSRDGIASEVCLLPVARRGSGFRRAPAAEPTFVFCGRLDREKGVELLLRAFSRLHQSGFPTARLRIVGRGPLLPELQGIANSLHLHGAVAFCGWQTPREVEAGLRDAWALVTPSLWAEPLGMVAVEAIVRGVPVIASAHGGLAEVVEHGVSGLLFPNGDEDALHDHLQAIALRRNFPTHMLPDDVVTRTQEKFDPGRYVGRMRHTFGQVITARSAPR